MLEVVEKMTSIIAMVPLSLLGLLLAFLYSPMKVLETFLPIRAPGSPNGHDFRGFLECVRANNIPHVKLMLSMHPHFANCTDERGRTALHVASLHNRPEMVQELLGYKKIQVQALDLDKMTALMTACLAGNDKVVALLVKVCPVIPEGPHNTATLHLAVASGKDKILDILLASWPMNSPAQVEALNETALVDGQIKTAAQMALDRGQDDMSEAILMAYGYGLQKFRAPTNAIQTPVS